MIVEAQVTINGSKAATWAAPGFLCYLNGDPNVDHLAGSGFAIVSAIFCLLEAVTCTYLMVRWA
jgi:hypothetical protein